MTYMVAGVLLISVVFFKLVFVMIKDVKKEEWSLIWQGVKNALFWVGFPLLGVMLIIYGAV